MICSSTQIENIPSLNLFSVEQRMNKYFSISSQHRLLNVFLFLHFVLHRLNQINQHHRHWQLELAWVVPAVSKMHSNHSRRNPKKKLSISRRNGTLSLCKSFFYRNENSNRTSRLFVRFKLFDASFYIINHL